MKTLSLALASLVLAFTASAATITGTVSNDTNQPLAGMTVTAYTTAGTLQSSGTTSATGTYALTVPAGTYHVLAYDPAGAFATSFYADAESFETSASLALTGSQSATNINFRLKRAGFLVGHVSAANLTVAAYNPSGTRRGFTKSDSTGSFTLALQPGSYKLVAYDEAFGYATTFFGNVTSFAASPLLSVAAGASTTADVELPPAAKLTGIVRDRTTFAGIAGARVTVYAADGSVTEQTLTGADGRYTVAVRPGALRMVVDDPAGVYATTYVADASSFSAIVPFAAAAGETLTIDATLLRGGRVTGRVTDRLSGAPLAGITAVAYNLDGTIRAFATSDANGAFSVVVPPGDYRLGTFDAALVYLPQFHPSQTAFATAATVHVAGTQTISGLDFALARGARVTGRVTSQPAGTPLGGITVAAYDADGRLLASTTTDATGAYTLLLAPATVKLAAFDPALQFATAVSASTVPLFAGQTHPADFVLAEAGRIHGVVTAANTLVPLAGMSVLVYDAGLHLIAETTTDATGTFRLAVPAGAYLLAAADPGHHYASTVYGDGTTINVAARQDIGPFPIRLAPSAAPSSARRRSVRH